MKVEEKHEGKEELPNFSPTSSVKMRSLAPLPPLGTIARSPNILTVKRSHASFISQKQRMGILRKPKEAPNCSHRKRRSMQISIDSQSLVELPHTRANLSQLPSRRVPSEPDRELPSVRMGHVIHREEQQTEESPCSG